MNFNNNNKDWEEYDSEYDSTWEDDNPQEKKKLKKHSEYKSRTKAAMMDMQNYRHGYTDKVQYYNYNQEYMPNLDFYQNKIVFQPDGVTIECLLHEWKEDYYTLEYNHSYIQWLFPLQERGVNPQASPMTPKEIQIMKEDKDVRRRLLKSYKLMLGFYGIKLQDEMGNVTHAENWAERFKNLNNHSHNNLRITRILKCLGELGYEHFQAPLVKFFLEETLCNKQLEKVKRSALDYFIFTVKDKEARKQLVHFAWKNYNPQNRFMWGPEKKLRIYNDEKQTEETESVAIQNKKEDNVKKGKKNGLDSSETQDEEKTATVLYSYCNGPSKHGNQPYSKPTNRKTKQEAILDESEDEKDIGSVNKIKHATDCKRLGEGNENSEKINQDIQSEYKNEENKSENRENKYLGRADDQTGSKIKQKESAGSKIRIVKEQSLCSKNDKGTKVAISMGSAKEIGIAESEMQAKHELYKKKVENRDSLYTYGSSTKKEMKGVKDTEDKKSEEIQNKNTAREAEHQENKTLLKVTEGTESESLIWLISSLCGFCCCSCYFFTDCCNFSTTRSDSSSI